MQFLTFCSDHHMKLMLECTCVKFDFDFLNLEKTTFCVLRFFYSFTASDGSEESTAGHVVSPCSIMMHHGFRS